MHSPATAPYDAGNPQLGLAGLRAQPLMPAPQLWLNALPREPISDNMSSGGASMTDPDSAAVIAGAGDPASTPIRALLADDYEPLKTALRFVHDAADDILIVVKPRMATARSPTRERCDRTSC
ncbi:hypothetical protein [Hoyosella subflava]|uniref:hypothetical protein n=1 Tax=Hoyosella subflava TaxID=639313 RepID=UPI001ED969A1|nr:hypothetical protein [Hoyosella subflava]